MLFPVKLNEYVFESTITPVGAETSVYVYAPFTKALVFATPFSSVTIVSTSLPAEVFISNLTPEIGSF